MSVDRQKYINFLVDVAFVGDVDGDFSESNKGYKKAINNAYRDLQRTMSYKKLGIKEDEIAEFKNECRIIIGNALDVLLEINDESSFDKWHKELCIKLSELNIALTIGQTQKWVNMTLKNLCILEEFEFYSLTGFQDKSKFFHVSIDTYVIENVKNDENLSIDINKEIREHSNSKTNAWSKWNDYDSYKKIQDQFRKELSDRTPFDWELVSWKKK